MSSEAHIIAWNEAETIHLTIQHYQKFCQKIVLHDNYSTDNTREIAHGMGCEIQLFGDKGVLSDEHYRQLKNHCWKGSKADWVIVCDADEILDTDGFMLAQMTADGVTVPLTYGWDVFSYDVPSESFHEITFGFHNGNYSKSAIFNPSAVREINYVYGCHVARPKGNIVPSIKPITLFHYRNIGGPERLVKRHALYRERLSEHNKRLGLGCHYLFTDEQRVREWEEKYKSSKIYSPDGVYT